MSTETWKIQLEEASAAQANALAASLADAILDSSPDVKATIRKRDAETMDLGSVIILILGSASAVAVARGIQLWLGRHQSASITVTRGKVEVKNVTSRDAVKLADILKKKE